MPSKPWSRRAPTEFARRSRRSRRFSYGYSWGACRVSHFSSLCQLPKAKAPMNAPDHLDEQLQDNALLLRVAGGDLAALEGLFTRYQRQIFQLALGITRDPTAA